MTVIRLLHAKLHRLQVTGADVDYVGSVTIDTDLTDQVGIVPLQEVEIWNASNGNRLSTYVLPGEAGSGTVCLNGAAAHLCEPGDSVIIAAYELRDREEVLRTGHAATVLVADERNRARQVFRQSLAPAAGRLAFHHEDLIPPAAPAAAARTA
jgi:aspartate 1-decarboxylase